MQPDDSDDPYNPTSPETWNDPLAPDDLDVDSVPDLDEEEEDNWDDDDD